MKYDVFKEYEDISDYSPFCHVNEVSPEYQKSPFKIPFVFRYSEKRPVHPDTFKDLGLDKNEVIEERLVYPTSSFRTVYNPQENACYKVPILRKITRGLRNLPKKELQRSEKATELLSGHPFEGFRFLEEECHYAEDDNFNYIKRKMPENECFPWFYAIKSQAFDEGFEMECLENIIKSWMFLASKRILLEYHTQNILVDTKANIYYRDLSDVRSDENPILLPSYYSRLSGFGDFLAAVFDRAVCRQNMDHFFRYDERLGEKGKGKVKLIIGREIEKYGLPFPEYSMDFPKDRAERVPQRTVLTEWRDFSKGLD